MSPSPNEHVEVSELVWSAALGDQRAWNGIVERYLPLVAAIARKHRLSEYDQEDVSQSLWLKLVDHLQDIREPRALPGWIKTVTRNLCLQVISDRQRANTLATNVDVFERVDSHCAHLDEEMLEAERRQAIRDGLDELTKETRDLLVMLAQDPPLSYRQISQQLGIPIGSIGPTRARCLERLRRTSAVREFFCEELSR